MLTHSRFYLKKKLKTKSNFSEIYLTDRVGNFLMCFCIQLVLKVIQSLSFNSVSQLLSIDCNLTDDLERTHGATKTHCGKKKALTGINVAENALNN